MAGPDAPQRSTEHSSGQPDPPPGAGPEHDRHHLRHELEETIERVDAALDRIEEEAIADATAAVAAAPTSPVRQVLLFVRAKARRVAVAIVGGAVLAAGLAMMVLPGPGVLVIIAGLGILATEFVWARKALDLAKERAARAKELASAPANRGRMVLLTGAAATIGALGAAWWFGLRS
jgi:uncharacterized protein (TIGR02611 family)